MTAKELILEHFSSLSPKLQVVARFVLDHPNEVVITSMRTLAERSQSAPATLVRLAQNLGYAGWPELKSAFAEDLGLHTEGYGERARSLAARGSGAEMLDEMFTVLQKNLGSTQAHCAESLRTAVKMIKRAKSVHIAGFRASSPIAYALFYGYRLFRNSVHLIDGQAGGLELQMRSIERLDVVISVSFAPYSREALTVIQQAKAANARVIAFTDSLASPLAMAADLSVLFAVDSPSFFPSVAAAIGMTEALLELLVAEGGAPVVEQIDHAEQSLFDSGSYLQAPQKRTTRRG